MQSARWSRWRVLSVVCLVVMLGLALQAHRNAERQRHQYALNTALFQAIHDRALRQVEVSLTQGADANGLENQTEPNNIPSALWDSC